MLYGEGGGGSQAQQPLLGTRGQNAGNRSEKVWQEDDHYAERDRAGAGPQDGADSEGQDGSAASSAAVPAMTRRPVTVLTG